jgi:hypothetical protein
VWPSFLFSWRVLGSLTAYMTRSYSAHCGLAWALPACDSHQSITALTVIIWSKHQLYTRSSPSNFVSQWFNACLYIHCIFKKALYESKPPYRGSQCSVGERLTSAHEALGFIPCTKTNKKRKLNLPKPV